METFLVGFGVGWGTYCATAADPSPVPRTTVHRACGACRFAGEAAKRTHRPPLALSKMRVIACLLCLTRISEHAHVWNRQVVLGGRRGIEYNFEFAALSRCRAAPE